MRFLIEKEIKLSEIKAKMKLSRKEGEGQRMKLLSEDNRLSDA